MLHNSFDKTTRSRDNEEEIDELAEETETLRQKSKQNEKKVSDY
jgi:hypothetical protein